MVNRTLDEYMKEVENSHTNAEGQMCEICGEERATNICIKCGKHVCSGHFVTIMGLCVECAPVKLTGSAPDGDANIQIPEKKAAAGTRDAKAGKGRPSDEKSKIEWV